MSEKKKSIEELIVESIVPKEEQRFEVPGNWVWTWTGAITEVVGGGTPKSKVKEYYDQGSIRWVTPSDLSGYKDIYISRGKRNITELGLVESSTKILPINTVLLSSRAPIGYVAIASENLCTNQGFKSFVPSNAYYPQYLYWYLKFSKAYLESISSGSTFKELSGSKSKKIPLPLPPLDEQIRIAMKVEGLLSKIEEAKGLINNFPDIIQSFRSGVISAACNGDLTTDWRTKQEDIESAMVILKNLSEKKMANKSEMKRNNSFRLNNELHHLEKWAVTKLGFICEMQLGKMLSRKAYGENLTMLPYLRNANVQWGRFALTDVLEMGFEESEIEKYLLKKGDLLVCEGGIVGRTAIWEDEIQRCMYQKALHRLRCDKDFILPEYIYYFLLDCHNKGVFEKLTSQTTIRHLTQEKLKEINIPIPPMREQLEIVRRVERFLSLADQLEVKYNEVCENLLHAEKSILQKAFRGELGTNEPSDENAIELLKEVLLRTSELVNKL